MNLWADVRERAVGWWDGVYLGGGVLSGQAARRQGTTPLTALSCTKEGRLRPRLSRSGASRHSLHRLAFGRLLAR